MSTLTKLFVVLLIVCSLLLTAGVVTFVNQADVYKTDLVAYKGEIDSLKRNVALADERAQSAAARETELASQMNTRIGQLQQEISTANQGAAREVAAAAQLRQRIAVQDANVADLTAAMKVGQQNLGDLQKRYQDAVAQLDQIRGQNVELVAANTDYQRRLDTLERELQYRDELIAQIRAQQTTAPAGAAAAAPGNGSAARSAAAPNIQGRVTSVRKEGDVIYATINLGAADRVARGMQFNVIDRQQGTFLGKLVVESVQQNDAFGRLEGPRVADVRPENEVRTQI